MVSGGVSVGNGAAWHCDNLRPAPHGWFVLRPLYIPRVPFDSTHRFLLSCDTRRHRVALDPARYWKPARCSACMQQMDRMRMRRGIKWLQGKAPRSGVTWNGRFRLVPADGIALLFAAITLLLVLVLHTVATDWWPATILLFLGRWSWLFVAAPAVLLTLAAKQWRALLIALVTSVAGLTGIMDFSFGTGRLAAAAESEGPIRIITFNMNGDMAGPLITGLIRGWEPDVIAIQECGGSAHQALLGLPGYNADIGDTCLLTRYPIVAIDSMRGDDVLAAGGAAWISRYRLMGPRGEFDLTNVHLDTPRHAVEALTDGTSAATGTRTGKTEVRHLESRLARRLVDAGRGPRIVAGDFDMSTESAIFRAHWSSLTDAFGQVGFGFGYTRPAGWIRRRIDHVLVDDAWVVKTARVLPDHGSDHLPVMVEVELKVR